MPWWLLKVPTFMSNTSTFAVAAGHVRYSFRHNRTEAATLRSGCSRFVGPPFCVLGAWAVKSHRRCANKVTNTRDQEPWDPGTHRGLMLKIPCKRPQFLLTSGTQWDLLPFGKGQILPVPYLGSLGKLCDWERGICQLPLT